jgi:hypothetical protein
MTMRRSFLMIASFALAVALIVLLVKIGRVDLRVTLQQLERVSLISFTKITLLNALMIYLSTEKWRSIDAAWRKPSDSIQRRSTSYALTSIGLAIGLFLPLQLAMATSRTLGTRANGKALKRGTAGTLLEQGFDAYTVGFLAVASAITWYCHGEARTWAICASSSIMLALLAVEPSVRIIRWLFASCRPLTTEPQNRILRSLRAIRDSGILNAGLARRMVVLSALRTGTVVLVSVEIAKAIGLQIPFWQMAAAIPIVSITNIIALTPGGIGIYDLAGAGALRVFGTPFAIGAQWVLANRVLVSTSYLLLAACAVVVLGAERIVPPGACIPAPEAKQ